jgi:hypothetical protein
MDEQRCGLCHHFQGEDDWGPCTIFRRDVSGYSGQQCRRYEPRQSIVRRRESRPLSGE